jgi:hypothetical protein
MSPGIKATARTTILQGIVVGTVASLMIAITATALAGTGVEFDSPASLRDVQSHTPMAVNSQQTVRVFTSGRLSIIGSVTPKGSPPATIQRLRLPAGTYLAFATAVFNNYASLAFQDNTRDVVCGINWRAAPGEDPDIAQSLSDGSDNTEAITIVRALTFRRERVLSLNCRAINGGEDRSYVGIGRANISALKIN